MVRWKPLSERGENVRQCLAKPTSFNLHPNTDRLLIEPQRQSGRLYPRQKQRYDSIAIVFASALNLQSLLNFFAHPGRVNRVRAYDCDELSRLLNSFFNLSREFCPAAQV